MVELDMPGLSVVVFDDNETVYQAARGVANLDTGEPVSDQSVFEAASLSKPVFAYFVLSLVEAGVLDLDRPLYEYLPMPELEEDGRYRVVTARMALSHQTGFPNWRWFDPAPETWGIPRGTMYMKREPGTFGYSGEGYNYLALVIADLTGRDLTTLDELYQENVVVPLGMACSSFVRSTCVRERKVMGHRDGAVSDDGWPRSFPNDTPQTFGAAGRLHTNAQDYARFMIALIEGEELQKPLRDEMLTEQIDLPEDSDTRRITGQTAWGLGIAIRPTRYGVRHEHGGNNGDFQSGMMFFADRGLGHVFLTNSDKGQEFGDALARFMTEGLEE